jgi:hypothetical protein
MTKTNDVSTEYQILPETGPDLKQRKAEFAAFFDENSPALRQSRRAAS